MSAVFITGTGTDVGKTFVCAGLIRYFRGLGQPVAALKPLVSGFDPAAPCGSDPAVLLEALGRDVKPEELKRVSPWRFRAPLSPDMAARAENKAIDLQAVVDFCRAAIAGNDGVLLIEGIGGIMVPLDDRRTVLDLMTALNLPLILVAGSYLGTLSHVLSAQDVILRHALDLRAIVVSETEGAQVPLDATLATLANFAKAPLLGLRRQVPARQNDAVFQHLAELIA
ncbi:MAG: dethiobiotin synthase [Pseudomonadota bacterium]|nr:dethiobiotin synthase [Pseudomonadota bacterium]